METVVAEVDLAVEAEAVVAAVVTVEVAAVSGAEPEVVVALDAGALEDVDGEDPPAVVDAVVVGAAQRRSSLSHIVTQECSSHVERRTRLLPVIWCLDQRCTARRGFQST